MPCSCESNQPQALRSLFDPRYNMIALPFSTRYQNSNAWVLETLAGVHAVDAAIRTRAGLRHAPLKLKGYQPRTADRCFDTLWAGECSRQNVAFDDHPDDLRQAGLQRRDGRFAAGFPAREESQKCGKCPPCIEAGSRGDVSASPPAGRVRQSNARVFYHPAAAAPPPTGRPRPRLAIWNAATRMPQMPAIIGTVARSGLEKAAVRWTILENAPISG